MPAAPALAWLHINCGVSCHNANTNSIAVAAGMDLRLDPNELDGRSSKAFAARRTTIDVVVETPQWNGATRIVPADPTNSLLLSLIGRREMNDQMPPIGTAAVDDADVAAIRTWIEKMPRVGGVDSTLHDGERGKRERM
jgi:hypothetical protein